MDKEKLCVFCVRHEIDYDPGSSCETCGYEASSTLRCGNGYWDLRIGYDTTTAGYRAAILKANTCADYQQA